MHNKNKNKDIEALRRHLPDNSIDFVYNELVDNNILLKISRPRTTKLGDYIPPVKNNIHRISININLNKYAFLITLLHELAHMKIWLKYKNKVEAHGKEWRAMFKKLLIDIDYRNIFPDDILSVLDSEMILPHNFKGNYKSKLNKVLTNYDPEKRKTLSDIGTGYRITLYNGRQFDVIERIRTRYKCKDVYNDKIYLVSANVQIHNAIKL